MAEDIPIWDQPEHKGTVNLMRIDTLSTKFNTKITGIIMQASKSTLPGFPTVAHLRLFLHLPNGTSVEIDPPGSKSPLRIEFRAYLSSNKETAMGVFPIRLDETSPTVLEVIICLLAKNRDHYTIHAATGSGCRHWCHTVISDFIDKGWVKERHRNCVDKFAQDLKADKKFKNVSIPFPSPEGTFYKDTGMKKSFMKSQSSSSIDELTDEEVYALIRQRSKATALHALDESDPLSMFVTTTTWRISEDAVAKATYSSTEAFIMSYVSSHTSIPVPTVRRVLPALDPDEDPGSQWIIMDYINGGRLQSEWPRMSWWKRLSAIRTVRRYIRELHRVPLPNPDVPGPFDESGQSHRCTGRYFTEDGGGPFRSYLDMAAWFDRRRFDVLAEWHSATGTIPRCPKFKTSHPLRLCHMDLHMGNLIIDTKGTLWFIDWANAGAFPPWLEYAEMARWADAAREEAIPPKIWTLSTSFMAGHYRKYKKGYLDKLRDGGAWDRSAHDIYPDDYFSKLGLTID